MIGREDESRAIAELLAVRRFVSIHGPGGIGNTTVGLAVAEGLLSTFEDCVCFLDLGLRAAGSSVPDVLAAALGLIVQPSDPAPNIVIIFAAATCC